MKIIFDEITDLLEMKMVREGNFLKRKVLIIATILVGLLNSSTILAQDEGNLIDDQFNNTQLKLNTINIESNPNDLYVQARNYFEGSGFEVTWDEVERKVIAKKDSSEIVINIDQELAIINGFPIEQPIRMIDESLYIPIIEISLAQGLKVKYDDDRKNLQLTNLIDLFREFNWDTNLDEIKNRSKWLKELADLGYVVAYSDYKLLNFNTQVYYHFRENRLKEIAYRLNDKERSLERFSKIRYELEQKYGKPEYDEPRFINEKTFNSFIEATKDKNQNEVDEIFFEKLVDGDLSISAAWKTEEFTVHLLLSGSNKKDITNIDLSIRQNGFVFTGGK
ncbi:copper amine oxidase N-terminal domain-containing protein [Paenibacillus sp. FSL H7-0331]|uniref:copper amine oxidase N-terminal domain-containing protein n=1 Tax=Paenibacillus sp. FSL H7-0331 TaxID=1920421 RepID=UPI00096D20A7|nr:copper amine oxidase N-terminal domain-containing protein [Paenibacillus sp. FSL H7-0331]OME97377.1 hypothetical protein BK127_40560 [Paenibacillus sp. FSL H7-0331]